MPEDDTERSAPESTGEHAVGWATRPRLALILLIVVVLGAAIAWWSGIDLSRLRGWLAGIASFRDAHPVATAAAYFALYVIVTAFSLPIAVWMTLAGGALFGFWTGLVLISFASSIGATLTFLAARWLLRDSVRARFGNRLQGIERGMKRDGGFYLFTLRLIPAVPFFVINLVMALTPMPALTFYLVSQAGMLAGTAVYVNAGTRLAQIDSLSGLVSLPLLLSFIVLGLFPWVARALVAVIRRRWLYRRWDRPRSFDRNLVVIGGGTAGLVSAYIAAAAKAQVTLIERDRMGGDCLNTGCVPSKALIRSAATAHRIAHADRDGLVAQQPQVPFDRVMERVHAIIAQIAPHDSVERYRTLGVDVRQGEARLVDPWTVEITDATGSDRLTARAIVLATGADPVMPDLPGLAEVAPMTSDTIWDRLRGRPHPPERLVVLGGGPVGSELAQALARLGAGVTQIERGERLLKREDADVSEIARAALEADGVRVLTGHTVARFGTDSSGKWLEAEAADTPGQPLRIGFDEILVAVGRKPRLTGMGLEQLGIDTATPADVADDYLQTRFPNILVAGDAAGPYQFTHVAAHQAWFAAVNAMASGLWRFRADYRVIPRSTFIDPEVATVGLTQAKARADGIAFELTRFDFSDLDRAITDSSTAGFVRVLTSPGKDRILGVTIVGAEAAELLAEYVLAMKHGLGLAKILGTIHAYPTRAEANKSVAGKWRRAHLSPKLLDLAEGFHDWRRG